MTRILFLFAACIHAMIFTPTLHAASEDIRAASRSVVRVAIMSEMDGGPIFIGHGSGVVVSKDMILTNAHVVEEANYDDTIRFLIIPAEGNKVYQAKLQEWNPDNDLALLKITDGGALTPATLYSGNVSDGSNVTAIGYPANVDVALQQQDAETLKPQATVKTRGSISAGRSSKLFATHLHTAPIAPGNSGGPIVDDCGRVLGVNSFGSTNQNGGSNFYFAVAIKEVTTFLSSKKVPFKIVSNSCRSVAEISQEEAKREAKARLKIEAEQRKADQLRDGLQEQKRRSAEYKLIDQRENHLALAGLLIALALFASGIALASQIHGKRNILVGATMAGIALFILSIATYFARPSFDQIEVEIDGAMAGKDGKPIAEAKPVKVSGKMQCSIDRERSRITISNDADHSFDWNGEGCVNKRTQYGDVNGLWSRSFVPNQDSQVSIVSFDPDKSIYRIERYLLGSSAMNQARKARSRYRVRGCDANGDKQQKIADMNGAIRQLLPARPNEILSFDCKTAQ